MAGFNPFAPQMTQQQQRDKAPQIQGIQAPNVAMQDKPGLMETIGPAVAEKAIGSDMAKSAGNYLVDSGKDAWSALTGPSVAPSAIPVTESVGVFTDAAMLNGMGTGVTAAAPTLAATGATAAEIAAGAGAFAAPTAAAGTVAAGTGAAAAAAPMALAAGPFAPLVLGGMMLAANSGK